MMQIKVFVCIIMGFANMLCVENVLLLVFDILGLLLEASCRFPRIWVRSGFFLALTIVYWQKEEALILYSMLALGRMT